MTARSPLRHRGFTIIELMIVLAMVAALTVLAAPGLQNMLANQRLSSAASDFMTAAMQARGTALKNNQRVIVQPTAGSGGAWADGYRIFTDVGSLNSTFDSGTDTVVQTFEALPSEITITKYTGTNNFFGYEGSGFLAPIGGSANGTWRISSSKTDRQKCMIIELSGRARLCDPKLVGTANCQCS